MSSAGAIIKGENRGRHCACRGKGMVDMIRNSEELRRILDNFEIPEEMRGNVSVLGKIINSISILSAGSAAGAVLGKRTLGGLPREARNDMPPAELLSVIEKKDKVFFDVLIEYMQDRGYKKDSDLYNRLGIHRSTFSKFRNGTQNPSRETVLRIALVLELKQDEAMRLLNAAGHAFMPNDKFDKFAAYFIGEFTRGRHYSLDKLNQWSVECTGQAIYGVA